MLLRGNEYSWTGTNPNLIGRNRGDCSQIENAGQGRKSCTSLKGNRFRKLNDLETLPARLQILVRLSHSRLETRDDVDRKGNIRVLRNYFTDAFSVYGDLAHTMPATRNQGFCPVSSRSRRASISSPIPKRHTLPPSSTTARSKRRETGIYHLSFSSTFATSVSVTAGTLDVASGSLFFSNVSLANQGRPHGSKFVSR